MPSAATTPAKASSRGPGGTTFKITIYATSRDKTYMGTNKKVLDALTGGYWLEDYFSDWSIQVEKADPADLEASI